MMKALLSIIDLIFYYLTIVIALNKIMNYPVRKKFLTISSLPLYGILMVLGLAIEYRAFVYIHILFQGLLFLSLKFSFIKIDYLTIIGVALLFNSINTIFSISCDTLLKIAHAESAFIYVDVLICIFIFLICIVASFNKRICTHTQEMLRVINNKTKWLTIISLFISGLTVTLMLSSPLLDDNNPWSISLRISTILLAILLLTIFPIIIVTTQANYYLKKQNEAFEADLEAQAQYYQNLSIANFELRQFRHDFKNMQIGLKTYLKENKSQEALAMLDEEQSSLGMDAARTTRYDSGNGIVDAILSDKQSKALAYNAEIIFEGSVPPNSLSSVDLCVLFGNTIDNAVEACAKISSDTKKIISVNSICNSGFMFVTISNPTAEDVVIRNNMIESTKEDKHLHGYGLHSLRKIAKKYNGELKLLSENKMFTVTIDLSLAK